MLKNADCTLYLYNKATQGFTRHIINGVYWRENKAGNVLRSGLQTADSTTIYFTPMMLNRSQWLRICL